MLTYAFTVVNNGNVTLTNIVLTDPEAIVAGGPIAALLPGASDTTTFTASYTVTQSDVDAGTFANTATVTATPPSGPDVSDTDTATVPGPVAGPSITVTKTANEAGFTSAGDVLTYAFTVVNNGNVTLTNITLTDPDAIVAGGPIAALLPGASDTTTFTASYTVTQSDVDAGTFDITATVTGTPPSGPDVSDTDTATVPGPVAGPSITVTKTANEAGFTSAGDVLTYAFTVVNNGNVTLTNIVLTVSRCNGGGRAYCGVFAGRM